VIASYERILTELHGQVHGAKPRSFHAEGYGLLANLPYDYVNEKIYKDYDDV
jgi:hypothetical protein